MRRRWMHQPGIAILIAAGLLLAACGEATPEAEAPEPDPAMDDPAEPEQEAPEEEAPAEQITLTWWDYFGYSPEADGAVTDMIARYEAENPHVTIQRTAIGFLDFLTSLQQAAATGEFPDIASIDNSDIPVFASQGVLADVTDFVENWEARDLFLPQIIDSAQHDGRYYGVPFRSNTTVLWYNQDIFDEFGVTEPPSTWEELRETARTLDSTQHSGFCFAAPPWEESTFTFLPVLWQAGGDVDTLGDGASIAALEHIHGIVREDGSAPDSILGWGQTDVGDQFGAGQCAMMVNGPWVQPAVDAGDFEWGVAPWPDGPAGTASPLGGEHWVVSANTPHQDAVLDLIDWLTEPANTAENIGAGLGSIPNRTDTIDDPTWHWHTMVPVFADQLSSAQPRGVYGENYAQISEAVWTMVQQVLTEEATPDEAAAAAAAAIEPLLP